MAGEQGGLVSRLRAVVEAKDAENAGLQQELAAGRELRRRLELRLAEVERRLSVDSSDSGTPSSKERIGAKEARRARQQSERERSKDRKRGGQPGHKGKGLARDPDRGEKKDAEPPPGLHAGAVSCEPVLNATAVLPDVLVAELTAYQTRHRTLPSCRCQVARQRPLACSPPFPRWRPRAPGPGSCSGPSERRANRFASGKYAAASPV